MTKAHFKKVAITPSGSGVHTTIEGDVNGPTIAFDADVNQTSTEIALKNATLTAAGTSVKGDLAVGLAGPKPSIVGALSSDKFDVTPLASGGGSGKSGGGSGKLFSRDPSPLDQLNAANADVTISVATLIYKGVTLQNLRLPIKLKDGTPVLLIKRYGEIFALSNCCPHMGCALAGGSMNGYVLTCPCHDWQFDIRTGRMFPVDTGVVLRLYEWRIDSGKIEIKVRSD